MKHLLVLLAALALTATARAQAPAMPPAEMQALDFLVGDWEGEGWMIVGPGQRQAAHVTETAVRKAGGSVLLLEGRGRATVEGGERIVHDAIGILRYDPDAQGYRMMACRAGAGCMDTDMALEDGALIWGFEDPRAGQIRYTMRVNEQGQWHEVGEISRDGGATWNTFMEMTLDRKGS